MAGKKDTPIFQYIVLAVFGAIGLVAVFVFSSGPVKPAGTEQPIHLWGTIDKQIIDRFVSDNKASIPGLDAVQYTKLDPRTYYHTLVEGIATGNGPDLIFVDHFMTITHWNKLWVIPFESYPEQLYRSSFAEGAEIFMTGGGVVALPFIIDPLVMYWNRDLFTNAGIAEPPKFWDEFYTVAPKITKVDNELSVLKSTISFGEVSNVTHSKEILSLLMLQAGTPILNFGRSGLESFLSDRFNEPEIPAVSALRFYTEFSNPIKNVYSWNRSLPSSRDAFIAGDLAVYFGFASEINTITKQNPNLNFNITSVPQVAGGSRRTGYANITGLAIPNAAKNKAGALFLANVLTHISAQAHVSASLGLPPVRRDMLAQPQNSLYWDTVYNSALISRVWHDPAPAQTEDIFNRMVESVSTGAEGAQGAVFRANSELAELVR